MRTVVGSLLLAGLVSIAASAAVAGESTSQSNWAELSQMELTRTYLEGTVLEANGKRRTVTVDDAKGPFDVLIQPETAIIVEGRKVTDFSAVPVGHVARIFFRNNHDAAYVYVERSASRLPETPR
jgi:ABC-type Fe3+-hydroxamate transport system substrate-binding protein